MEHPYVSFDPHATITAETLQSAIAAFRLQHHLRELFQLHGLPTVPQAGDTYRLQFWLNLLADIERLYGSPTVYSVGLNVVSCCKWPAGITTLDQALSALDRACRANVAGDNIGYYACERAGVQERWITCLTPTPAAFEYGLLTGVARQFKPAESLLIRVEERERPPHSSPLLKCFGVKWQ